MKSFEEVERAIIKWLETSLVLPLQEKRREALKKQRELVEEQEKLYRPNINQLQKQFTI